MLLKHMLLYWVLKEQKMNKPCWCPQTTYSLVEWLKSKPQTAFPLGKWPTRHQGSTEFVYVRELEFQWGKKSCSCFEMGMC